MIRNLLAVAVLGLTLSGCDKCGGWFWEAQAPKTCRTGSPSG